MDQWVQLIGNIGGMGGLAIALFVLHRDAIKSFTEELSKERHLFQQELSQERDNNQNLWKSYMDLKIRQHEQLLASLVAQDKALERILNNQEISRGFLNAAPQRRPFAHVLGL